MILFKVMATAFLLLVLAMSGAMFFGHGSYIEESRRASWGEAFLMASFVFFVIFIGALMSIVWGVG